jgi:hypothetical protein
MVLSVSAVLNAEGVLYFQKVMGTRGSSSGSASAFSVSDTAGFRESGKEVFRVSGKTGLACLSVSGTVWRRVSGITGGIVSCTWVVNTDMRTAIRIKE